MGLAKGEGEGGGGRLEISTLGEKYEEKWKGTAVGRYQTGDVSRKDEKGRRRGNADKAKIED